MHITLLTTVSVILRADGVHKKRDPGNEGLAEIMLLHIEGYTKSEQLPEKVPVYTGGSADIKRFGHSR